MGCTKSWEGVLDEKQAIALTQSTQRKDAMYAKFG